MLKALFTALSLALAMVTAPTLAQTAADTDKKIDDLLGGPHAIYATAIRSIQTALENHDVQGIAGYVSIGDPLKVDGADVTITDFDDLTAKFDTLFTPKVVSAVTGQTYETLTVNANGIMFGDGELWISGVCDDASCQNPFINITAINTR